MRARLFSGGFSLSEIRAIDALEERIKALESSQHTSAHFERGVYISQCNAIRARNRKFTRMEMASREG